MSANEPPKTAAPTEATSPGPSVGSAEGNPPGFWHFFVALCVFASGAFIGFFVSGWGVSGLQHWRMAVGIRLIWQVGGALWCGWAGLRVNRGSIKAGLVGMLIFGMVGSLLSLNPLLDVLVEGGPVRLKSATVVDYGFNRDRSGKGLPRLSVHVGLRTPDGRRFAVGTGGYQAHRWIEAIESCEKEGWKRDQPVEVTLLVHLDTLLEFHCPAQGHGGPPAPDPPVSPTLRRERR